MASLNDRPGLRTSLGSVLTRRFSQHPERYLEIFRVLRKYQLYHLATQFGLNHRHDDADGIVALGRDETHGGRQGQDGLNGHAARAGHAAYADSLASALEELGPCFIKLGQLLSTRPDLLPPPYITALSRLQDRIAPVPSEQVIQIVEQELGAPVSDLFQSFDRSPLAAASIAQVHRAVLPSGDDVVVKVQRPGVRRRIEIDLEVLHEVAHFSTNHTSIGARFGAVQMVRELEHSLTQEIDFRQEAENTRLISRQIAGFPRLTTPAVHDSYTTRRVLTMSLVRGRHLAALSPDELRTFDSRAIAKDLLAAYLKQIAIDGIFHCDPHPGNILLADDGRLALMDFGMVGRFDAGQKDNIILLLLAFAERLGQRVADTYLDMVEVPKGFDRRAFAQDIAALVSRYHDMSGGRMALGTALLDLTKVASAHGTPVPTAMTLLGKTMLNLDGAIRVLSPELDPVELIRDYMMQVMQERVMAQLSPGRVFAWVLDMKHLFENSPRRADIILDKLASDQFAIRLEVDRLDEAMRNLNRAAGRLSLGMIAGSLIIGGGYVLGSLLKSKNR
ncbi:MAG: AarF/ABC1/UbiB kinase family protein [Chloroflexi bacterium]|nr:AarF/ABC1/UbiB kinase family protein [Chloroflexota bacterium]